MTQQDQIGVTVSHDGWAAHLPKEYCCKCQSETNYWYTPKDVALCQECAKTVTADHIPTKAEWCASVRKTMGWED